MHIYSTPCSLYDDLPTISVKCLGRGWCPQSPVLLSLSLSHSLGLKLPIIFWNNISRSILKTQSVFVYKITVTISFLYNEWPRGRSSDWAPKTPITVKQRRMPAVFPMSWRFWLLQRTKPRRSWQHPFRRSGGRLFIYLNQMYTFSSINSSGVLSERVRTYKYSRFPAGHCRPFWGLHDQRLKA